MVAYHKPEQVQRVLYELDRTNGTFRYVIVNNSSEPDVMDAVINNFKEQTGREVCVLHSKNPWFTPALNIAIREAMPVSRMFIYVCSVHTKVHHPNWLRSCLRWMRGHRRAGLAGSVVMSPGFGNRFDRCNLAFYKRRGCKFNYRKHFNKKWWRGLGTEEKYKLPHVQGGIWVMERRMISRIGLPSDEFFFSFVDVEYSFRAMSHGWHLGDIPGVWADEGRWKFSTPKGTLISHARRNAEHL